MGTLYSGYFGTGLRLIKLNILSFFTLNDFNLNTGTTAKKEIMKSHLTKHYKDIRDVKLQYDESRNKIQSNIGIFLDSTKLKIIWIKVATFSNDAFQSYYDLFQVN